MVWRWDVFLNLGQVFWNLIISQCLEEICIVLCCQITNQILRPVHQDRRLQMSSLSFLILVGLVAALKKNWISWSLSKSFIFKRKFYLWSLRQWQPTPVLLPGKSHGRKSLVGCSPLGRYESDTTERLHFHALEKEMATHSSVLAWRIPEMAESGGLPSMGSHRVGHDWSNLATAAAVVQ